MNDKLKITSKIFIDSSGINKGIIKKDIENGTFRPEGSLIWYETAYDYCLKKWEQGKVKMYPPDTFFKRVLFFLECEIASGRLIFEWENKKK